MKRPLLYEYGYESMRHRVTRYTLHAVIIPWSMDRVKCDTKTHLPIYIDKDREE